MFHRKANKNHHEKIHLRRPGVSTIGVSTLHQNLDRVPLDRSPVPGHTDRRARSASEPPPTKRPRIEKIGGQILTQKRPRESGP